MERLITKLMNLLPDFPKLRYGIFSGTNQLSDILLAVAHACLRGFSCRETIREYEGRFAAAVGSSHAISFGAGRMALYAILKGLNLRECDEIILPAFTCVVVPNAFLYAGVKPVYVDIDPVTFNLDPAKVESLITPRTRALYIQHTFGVVSNIEDIQRIAVKHGLLIIEDAAHSLGASWGHRKSGSIGDIAFFSTDHSKVINTLLGGMVTTSNDELAGKIRAVQATSPTPSATQSWRMIFTFAFEVLFYHPAALWIGRSLSAVANRLKLFFYFRDELLTELPGDYPYPCRLISPLARIGLIELGRLPKNLEHRRAVASLFESHLHWYRGTEGERIGDQAWLRYSFLVKDRADFVRRNRKRFDLGIWFTSVTHGRSENMERVGYREGSCPTAEGVARSIVNFPTHPRIPLRQIKATLEENKQWLRDNLIRLS